MGSAEVLAAPTSRPWSRAVSLLLRFTLLGVAIFVLRRELDGVRLQDLLAQLRGYGFRHVAIAILVTVASFLTLGLLEVVALGYVGNRAKRMIPSVTAVATGFIAHAYSQSVGLAILTGGAVRARSYSRYGLNAADVARMSVFVTLTATLGLITTGGFALLELRRTVAATSLPVSPEWLGLLLLLPVFAYVAWSARGKAEFYGSGKWRVRRPSFRLALGQITLSSLDWLFAGTVLYAVLPASLAIAYGMFLGIYLVAQTAAVVSHVPGGLGVFEAIVIMLCTAESGNGSLPPSTTAALVASLLVYRIIYYVLPLIGALGLSGFAELRRARTSDPRVSRPNKLASIEASLPIRDAI